MPTIPSQLPLPVKQRLLANNYAFTQVHDYSRTVSKTEIEDHRTLRASWADRVWLPLPTAAGYWWCRVAGSLSAEILHVVLLSNGPHYCNHGYQGYRLCTDLPATWQRVMEAL